MRDHTEIGDFDAPGAGRSRQFHAPTEVLMGAGHPASRIFGVTQAAKRARLDFWRTGSSGAVERPLMLLQAFDNPSEREAEIAPQVVDPRALRREVVGGRRGRGLVQHREGLVETIRHAEAASEPKPGSTPLDVNIGYCQGLPESSNRF
jgi:hypothetical protein